MSDDNDARRIVLARRARFIAATLAGIGAACAKDERAPFEDAGTGSTDAQVPHAPDAGAADAGPWTTEDASFEGGTPIPCLPMIIMSLNERRSR